MTDAYDAYDGSDGYASHEAHEAHGGRDGHDPYDGHGGGRSHHGDENGPGHDTDVVRTFAALPPVHGRGFAGSWWGQAWIRALEDTALDGEQLARGRRQARAGAVGAVSVRPGRVTAVVRDRDDAGQRCDVLLTELTGPEWDRFLDMAVDRSGHIAALLDREMPPHLVEDAAAAGVELLPGIGDLEPECGCDAWDLCPHAAALCYAVARLLDQDPFVLLLMRGRAERRLLDELQVRSAARAAAITPAAAAAREPEGLRADEAYAARDILPPLPAPLAAPDEPGQPPALDALGEDGPGIDPAALEFLAADAAARARRLLVEALAPGHARRPPDDGVTIDQDGVRMAASAPGPVIAGRLAAGLGRPRAELESAAHAWRIGGAAALALLDERRTPGPETLARAAAALESAWDEGERPRLRACGPGRWTVVGAQSQLRVGDDGRWWTFRKERGRWSPSGPGAHDPATALAESLGEPA